MGLLGAQRTAPARVLVLRAGQQAEENLGGRTEPAVFGVSIELTPRAAAELLGTPVTGLQFEHEVSPFPL